MRRYKMTTNFTREPWLSKKPFSVGVQLCFSLLRSQPCYVLSCPWLQLRACGYMFHQVRKWDRLPTTDWERGPRFSSLDAQKRWETVWSYWSYNPNIYLIRSNTDSEQLLSSVETGPRGLIFLWTPSPLQPNLGKWFGLPFQIYNYKFVLINFFFFFWGETLWFCLSCVFSLLSLCCLLTVAR